MARKTIKYYENIDRRGGCDCPFPVTELHSNARLGRASLIRMCCIAEKLSGGTPTNDGVPITDFVDVYDFTHTKSVKGPRNEVVKPESAVADRPWDADEIIVLADADPEAKTKRVTRKKGEPPAWLWKRLAEKGLYKEMP